MPRGGKRPGSGRKTLPEHLKKRQYTTRLPGWLIDWIRENDRSGADLIETALMLTFRIKPPKQDKS